MKIINDIVCQMLVKQKNDIGSVGLRMGVYIAISNKLSQKASLIFE